MIKSKKYS